MERVDLRSDEELMFSVWLDEAIGYGLVRHYEYEPETFVVHPHVFVERKKWAKTKVNYLKNVPLFDNKSHGKGIDYTPDFKITLSDEGRLMFRNSVFWRCIQSGCGYEVWVDVKGAFSGRGGHEAFYLKQRMLWDTHGIYVKKVNPKVFFKQVWAPEEYRWMKNRRVPTMTKLGTKTVTFPEYFAKNKWMLATGGLDANDLYENP